CARWGDSSGSYYFDFW
nr:immunoglobulin heavy chain junction region [Macaca mulatta]MOV53502.1 immunoglobulin heavy chain junction region [Macaca mulatta]MOV53527.1 immunoglobulin heavy chain junction region [Macaca mulatta]MOV53635.1 immunoglobulin heavy chain junction region [Macaca mulatta]MOV53701.1 immunoglobulin heavy chain junction region [Macaca mulatta]